MTIENRIMNIPCVCCIDAPTAYEKSAYAKGHRDARHAAAEIVSSATPGPVSGSPDDAFGAWLHDGNNEASVTRADVWSANEKAVAHAGWVAAMGQKGGIARGQSSAGITPDRIDEITVQMLGNHPLSLLAAFREYARAVVLADRTERGEA